MSNQVVKIELKGKRFLELLQTVLKDQLPADATVEAVYHNPHSDMVGVLVASKDYPVVEGGDLVFYAKGLELLSAKEFKTVVTASGDPVTVTNPIPATDSKTGGK
jgi:hypothetical protein